MISTTVLQAARDAFDALAQTIDATYIPTVGASSTIRVLLAYGIRRVGFESDISESHDEVSFLVEDVPDSKRGDVIDTGATSYELRTPIENDGVTVTWLVR